MVERVLDTRISNVSEDGDVAEVSGQVAIVFSDLHLSLQSKKYDKLLSANGFDTVGALKVVTSQDLLELGVLQGHLALVLNALFPPEDQPEPLGTKVGSPIPNRFPPCHLRRERRAARSSVSSLRRELRLPRAFERG